MGSGSALDAELKLFVYSLADVLLGDHRLLSAMWADIHVAFTPNMFYQKLLLVPL